MSIAIMSRLFKAQLGSANRKMLAVRLADFADDDGKGIWPTVERLAQETEMSERTVQRILAEFVSEGLLFVRKKASGKPGEATRYDFNMAAIRSLKCVAETNSQGCHGDARNEADGCHEDTRDTGKRVTSATETGDTEVGEGCHGGTRTIIEPPLKPSKREGAHADNPDAGHEPDNPAKFVKRVKALEIGTANNPWPGAIASSTQWAVQQFAKLTPEERLLAEERRDIYLAACEAQKVKPVPPSVYLRDRKFLDVAAPTRQPVAAGTIKVAPFGPVWAARRALELLAGPEPVNIPENLEAWVQEKYETLRRTCPSQAKPYLIRRGIWLTDDGALVFPPNFADNERRKRTCEQGFPEVNRLHGLAKSRDNDVADARFAAIGDLCEPVRVGSELYREWEDFHKEMGWPFVPDPEFLPVVYFPRGGPGALEKFRTAARAALGGAEPDFAPRP